MPEKVINARAPTRISFAGGGTDVESYFKEHGGCVINFAIDVHAYSNVTKLQKQIIDLESVDLGFKQSFADLNAMKLSDNPNLLKLIIEDFGASGIKLFSRSEFPPKSGIGGSATFSVSAIGAINKLLGKNLSPRDIANKAYEIERIKLGIKGGWQDQLAAAYGGFNFMEFSADKIKVNPVKISRSTVLDLEKHMVLGYLMPRDTAHNIHAKQEYAIKKNEADVLNALHKTKEMGYEMKDYLVSGNIEAAGKLLADAWDEKKKSHPGASNEFIDRVYDVAIKSGAYGGKVSGAGGGGYMFFICQTNKEHIVAEALTKTGAKTVPFKFTTNGLEVWET